ncbi:MAG: HEPN domain-containing protein [Candidatus Saganbacteria bacterium]|uniref:HEPN domain-containing protein n=1 Tax=Candidatus Saganbacteria bacterium TaxID=2575572 RepID=A0A833L1I6_UNCSA|nr:MAG: HEPN domain-containing protein [Candidatus Saganbacteria bacterium]
MNPNEYVYEKANEWFAKGDNDLKAARLILNDHNPPTDTICYHCQQAVEKYLKGLLTLHKIEFLKTHDLDYLYKLIIKVVDINAIKEEILSLSKYAIEARYPADVPIVYSIEEAKSALEKAANILKHIKLNK